MSRDDLTPGSREWLSALADGEADGPGLDRACAAWTGTAEAREAWHSYHLIGDVMRSEELSSAPKRDEAFLQALRARLDSEPVVLAPEASATEPSRPPRRHAWLAPAAVAAGFAAVAGVLVVTRLSAPEPAAGTALLASGAASAVARVDPTTVRTIDAAEPTVILDQQLVRDARLDSYFQAHRGASGGSAFSGSLRNVDIVVPQR